MGVAVVEAVSDSLAVPLCVRLPDIDDEPVLLGVVVMLPVSELDCDDDCVCDCERVAVVLAVLEPLVD